MMHLHLLIRGIKVFLSLNKDIKVKYFHLLIRGIKVFSLLLESLSFYLYTPDGHMSLQEGHYIPTIHSPGYRML